MTEKKIIAFWKKSSNDDYKTAKMLFTSKRYHHALFFCHLAVEKMLKSVFIKKKHEAPPWIHNLGKLAVQSGMDVSPSYHG